VFGRVSVENGPKLVMVNSLKSKADFLIHRVVLQFSFFLVFRPMFHVKHFCVRGLLSQPT
jgi:hypothetical protein